MSSNLIKLPVKRVNKDSADMYILYVMLKTRAATLLNELYSDGKFPADIKDDKYVEILYDNKKLRVEVINRISYRDAIERMIVYVRKLQSKLGVEQLQVIYTHHS